MKGEHYKEHTDEGYRPSGYNDLEVLDIDCSTMRFCCPNCGSGYYGTSYSTKPYKEWIGECHGEGCDFTWKRYTHDKSVFVPIEDPNQEEIEQLVASLGKLNYLQLATIASQCIHRMTEMCERATN